MRGLHDVFIGQCCFPSLVKKTGKKTPQQHATREVMICIFLSVMSYLSNLVVYLKIFKDLYFITIDSIFNM